jgi:hypothetical protein
MASFEILAIILTGLGLSASILYYTMVLRNANKTQQLQLENRQAQLFMNIYSQINSNDAIHNEFEMMNIELKTADDYHELYNDKTKYTAINWFMTYFEGMGVLVRQGLVDIDLVSQMLSGNIIWFWERYRDAFNDCRVKYNWPRWMIESEYLYDRVKEHMNHYSDNGINTPDPTKIMNT